MTYTPGDPSPAPPPVHEGAWVTPDGLRLHTKRWLPPGTPRSSVVIVHGYAEHCGRYGHVAAHLTQHRHAVYTYDQRGYGRSEGRRAFIRVFDQYLDDLGAMLGSVRAEAPDRPLFLFGHSMGGAIATLYCLERDADFQGLLLSSPALRVSSDVAPILQKLSAVIGRLLPRLPTIALDRAFLSHDQQVVAHAEQDPLNFHGRMPARTGAELIHATRRIARQMERLALPVLLLHGTDDRLTDPAGSTALYQQARSRDKTLALYPGFYHETFNEPEKAEVLDQITAWLDEHLS